MELQPDTSHKENVPPKPGAPLRPEQQRFRRTLGVGLDSGCGQWVPKRGRPAATPSPGAALHQEPCGVQTNLASPGPRLGLVLKDTVGPLVNSSFWQQSNLQPATGRPRGKAREFAQQSNLSISETTSPCLWPEPRESFGPHVLPWGSPLPQGPPARPSHSLMQSRLLATDTQSLDFRPAAGFAPLNGRTQPGPRSWRGLGNWTSRLEGQPLTLEDLAVPAQSQARAPSHAAIHELLASVRRLEQEAARLKCRVSQGSPGAAQWDPWPSSGQAPQPSRPVLASWHERRKRHPRGHRKTADFLETQGAQAGLSNSGTRSKPALPETTLGMLPGDLDPQQGPHPAHPLGPGEDCSPEPVCGRAQRGHPRLPQGVSSREATLCSSAFSSAAPGGLPGRKGEEGAPKELASREEERTASCLPDTAPARSTLQNQAPNIVPLESAATRRQLLSRCFRAWRHLARSRRAMAAAVALGHRRLLRRGFQALRWAPWLREARLEAARGRYTKALLARSFREWRNLALQREQGKHPIQAGSGLPPPRGGQGQGPSLGRKAVADPAQRTSFTFSPGSPREEEERPQHIRSHPGQRPADEDVKVQTLQALRQLAVFLLWCHQKEQARQNRGVLGEATGATQKTWRTGRPPQAGHCHAAHAARVDCQQQRAWLCRCFGAWQRFVQRGSRCRAHLADRRAGILRTCLGRWVQMKQLRGSDGAKVTQLSLCLQKAGHVALRSSAPGATKAQDLGAADQAQRLSQEQGRDSLQEACRRLALHRALLLWRTRLSLRQWANSFFQSMRHRLMRRTLRRWHLRAWGPGSPSGCARIALVLEPPGSVLGGQASLGRSTPCSSLEKVRGRPSGELSVAAGQQQGLCLLLWQVPAQQSRGAMRWSQCTLQRRVLLSWSHWATAQAARRELAARWAWRRSCRAALCLWRRRLAQWQEAERWARERAWRLARDALCCWHSCWQRQQFLRDKYQRWVRVRLQRLQRAVFQGWQQATVQRRHTAARPEQLPLQSYLQAWLEVVRDPGVHQARRRDFQDGLRRRALAAMPPTWREAPAAAARAQGQLGAQASPARWRSLVQRGWADRQLRRARARLASKAWQAALGWHHGAQQPAEWTAGARAALCCSPGVCQSRLGQSSRAHTARELSAWVLEAWAQSVAQGHVQRAAVTQLQQAGRRRLLQTHWAQWQTALLRVRLDQRAAAQKASTVCPRPQAHLTHWPRMASRGHLLLLLDTPAPWKQGPSSLVDMTPPRFSVSLLALHGTLDPSAFAEHPASARPTWEALLPGAGQDREDNPHPLAWAPGGPSLLGSGFPLWLFPQIHSCWTQARGPVLPGPALQHSLGGQRTQRETSWAQSKETLPWVTSLGVRRHQPSRPLPFPGWLQWPGRYSWAPGPPPTGPGGHCSPEPRALKGQGWARKRRLGARSCRVLEEQAQARGSALLLAMKVPDALGRQEEAPTAPFTLVPQACRRSSRRAGAARERGRGSPSLPTVPIAQRVASEKGLADMAAADPETAGGSTVIAARRQPDPFPGTGISPPSFTQPTLPKPVTHLDIAELGVFPLATPGAPLFSAKGVQSVTEHTAWMLEPRLTRATSSAQSHPGTQFGNKAWPAVQLLLTLAHVGSGSLSTHPAFAPAFKKWHQRLAARSPRRGAASSPTALAKPGPGGPWSRQEAPESPGVVGLGAQLQL
ncbi:LOW QUALITY PROTEIN: uncharacterized protein C1orf167 homolog [Eulemur rufifrons]|uniref:LOW QUALITY PROTEIN: uncharacterized protein C1orf167 homolog n=1 Tax=Eulemur rufifrons TaxID=859984 RepID=UPI00374386D4